MHSTLWVKNAEQQLATYEIHCVLRADFDSLCIGLEKCKRINFMLEDSHTSHQNLCNMSANLRALGPHPSFGLYGAYIFLQSQ